MFKDRPKVLIVGAGPVGMFAALALAKRGVPVSIVDTGLWACSHSYASALHPQSLDLLKQAGLEGQVWATANPVNSIGFYDATGRKAQIRLDDNGSSPLAVVRQSALEDLLEKALGDLNVPVMWRHEVPTVSDEDGRTVATVNELKKKFRRDYEAQDAVHTEWEVSKTSNIEADFVLGADGHNSQVRRGLGFDFPEVGPAQYYAVFEFKSDEAATNETRIVLGERTTDVLWPLPGGDCRWSFQLPDYSDTEAEQLKDRLLLGGFGHFPTKRLKSRAPAAVGWGAGPALDKQHLERLIAERAPWFTGSIDALSWRTIVRFEKRLVSRFGDGRIWLAGDAAHLAPPAAVQSMNMGLLEANELAGAFSRILAGEGSQAELEDYNNRWTATWRQLHGLEGGLRATSQTDPWIRDRADRLMACLPAHGTTLAHLAAQLGLEVTESARLKTSVSTLV